MKKLIISLFTLLLALASATYLYYANWRDKQQASALFPCIPQTAALVYEVKGFGKQWEAFQQTTIAKDLGQLPIFKTIQENLTSIQELVEDPKLLEEASLTVSVHGLGEEQLGYIFYFNTYEVASRTLLETIASKIKASKDYSTTTRKYAGYKITEISQNKRFFYTKHDRYIVVSTSSLLIEDVIRNLASKSPNGFLPFKKASGNQGSFYVNFGQLPHLLRPFVKSELFNTISTRWSNFAQFGQLELKLANHHLLFSGFVNDQGTTPCHFTRILAGQTPGPVMLMPYLPQSTASTQHFTFGDAEQFFSNLKQYRAVDQTDNTVKKAEASLLTSMLYPLLKGEIGHCTLEAKHSYKEEELVFIKVSDPQAFMEALTGLNLLISLAPQRPELLQTEAVFKLRSDCFRHWLPGQLFPGFEAQYITQIEDYIVLANSQMALQTWYIQCKQGKTWAKSSTHNALLESTLEQAHFSFFVDLPKAWFQILHLLKPIWQQTLETHAELLKQFLHISLQLLHEQDTGCYVSLLFKHQEAYPRAENQSQQLAAIQEKSTQRSPITSIDFQTAAPIITQPWMVKSHRTPGHYALLQDAQYQLYFLDPTGKLIWTKRLEGPITTDLFEVDFYKNNKIQYLFATKTHVHLIDYYGREVSKYPHVLPQANEHACLKVISYNKDKNYRLLIATPQGNIYLKDIHYKSLPAWDPKALEQPFADIPFHQRIQDKDYLIALQENGMLQVLDLKAQTYPGFPIDLGATVHNAPFLRQGKSVHDTSLAILMDTGKHVRLNLVGEIQEHLQFDQPEATSRFVLCLDSVTKHKCVIMRRDTGKVVLIDETGKVILEHQTKAQDLVLQYYDFGGIYQFYVLTELTKHLTYIYNHTGKLVHDTPLLNTHKVSLLFSEEEKSLYIYTSFEGTFLKQVLACTDLYQ